MPVPIDIDPDAPHVVIPELNTNAPLTPFAPEFGVVNTNDPLDVDFDHPVAISMLPPFPVKASPATTDILPPSSDHLHLQPVQQA